MACPESIFHDLCVAIDLDDQPSQDKRGDAIRWDIVSAILTISMTLDIISCLAGKGNDGVGNGFLTLCQDAFVSFLGRLAVPRQWKVLRCHVVEGFLVPGIYEV